MLKTCPLYLLAIVGIAIGLSSCEEQCDPIDADVLNALYLEFNTGSDVNAFSQSDLDSMYMVRYQEADIDSFLFPVDTFNLYDIGFTEGNNRIRLSRGYPTGTPEGPPYYTEYMYRFLSRNENWQVRLQQIEVEGSYIDDCTYEARSKRFVLNEDTLNRPGNTSYVQVFKD